MRRHPGAEIGVRPPELAVRQGIGAAEYAELVAALDEAERDDPVVRPLLETVAVLRASGVPRIALCGLDELADDDGDGAQVEGVLTRLCVMGLLRGHGDRVAMAPDLATAVLLRADRSGRVQELIVMAAEILYAHALQLRGGADEIAFHGADPSNGDVIVQRTRALLDQAVTLAARTGYAYDKPLDIMLQCDTCLAHLGRVHDSLSLSKELAKLCVRRLGPVHPVTRDAVESAAVSERLAESIAPKASSSGSRRYRRAQALYEKTVAVMESGRLDDQTELFRQTVRAHRKLAEHEDGYLPDLAVVLNNLGMALQSSGPFDELVQVLREELDVRGRLAAGGEPNEFQQWGRVHSVLGLMLTMEGRTSEGLPLAEEGVRIRRQVEADFPVSMAHSLVTLARILLQVGRVADAGTAAVEAAERWRRLAPERLDPMDMTAVAQAHHLLAQVHRHAGSPNAAVEEAATAVQIFTAPGTAPHPDSAFCLGLYAELLEQAGRRTEAVQAWMDTLCTAADLGLSEGVTECLDGLRTSYHDDPALVEQAWAGTIGGPLPRWLVGDTPG